MITIFLYDTYDGNKLDIFLINGYATDNNFYVIWMLPKADAKWHGVFPYMSCKFGLHPAFNRINNISISPLSTALCNGVCIIRSLQFKGIPEFIIICKIELPAV